MDTTPLGRMVRGIKSRAAAFTDATNRDSFQRFRDINGRHFDVLTSILFDDDFNVMKAALIPITFVVEQSIFVAHTNSNKFILWDEVWKTPGVRDVTAEIAAAMP